MKPIGKYIIINKIKEENKTESGLLLSASNVDEFRYRKGKDVKAGSDVSVISKYTTTKRLCLYYDNKRYTLYNYS